MSFIFGISLIRGDGKQISAAQNVMPNYQEHKYDDRVCSRVFLFYRVIIVGAASANLQGCVMMKVSSLSDDDRDIIIRDWCGLRAFSSTLLHGGDQAHTE